MLHRPVSGASRSTARCANRADSWRSGRLLDPFLTQLAELCRTERTRAKWVLVPGHALGHTLGERLAREGTSWASLRFTPPFELALEMAAPFLVEQGIDPGARRPRAGADRPAAPRPARVDAALLPPPRRAARHGRRPVGHAAGAPHGGRSRPPTSRPSVFEVPAKAAELAALLRAYERHLATERLADAPLVYQEALRHLDVCPIHPGDLHRAARRRSGARSSARFLDALPGERVPARILAPPGLEAPRRLRPGLRTERSPQPRSASDAERLAWLLRPEEAPPPRATAP